MIITYQDKKYLYELPRLIGGRGISSCLKFVENVLKSEKIQESKTFKGGLNTQQILSLECQLNKVVVKM